MPDFGNTSVFSQTDGSNNSGTMPSWSGSAAPSTLDDAGRAFQGAATREWNWRNYTLTTAGTTTAYTLTYSVAPAAYYNGQRYAAIINATNTGSSTLNVNSLGATTIKKVVAGTLTNLAAGDLVAGMFVELAYNTANTCFVLINRGADVFADLSNTFSAAQTFSGAINGSGGINSTRGSGGASINWIGDVATANWISSQGGFALTFMNDASTGDLGTGTVSALATTWYPKVRLTTTGGVSAAGSITTNGSSALLGYATGAGGTVTQTTSRGTAVTINKPCGQITMFTAAGSASWSSFTVNNSLVSLTDTVLLTPKSTIGNGYQFVVGRVASGSFDIFFQAISGTATDTPVINFAVIKAVNA